MSSAGPFVAIFDLGSGSGRCTIFDFDGNQIALAQREWLPLANPKYPGARDFDTRNAWSELAGAAREALATSGIPGEAIAAVTSTSMREGMVLFDKSKRVVWACPNEDARASEEVVAMIKKDLARPIYQIGGDWLTIISPPRFWWIRNKMPDLYQEIAHMCMLSDWVLFELSGEIVTDPSVGSSSGMFDLASRRWSEKIIDLAGLPSGIYPPVYESGTLIGTVSKAAAVATGFKAGTPVVTGGADTQLALVGAGAVQPGMRTTAAGTFWLDTVVTSEALIDPEARLRTLCHVLPGQWMTEGVGFHHGFTMRWFRDGFCQEERRIAREQNTDAYSLMEQLASGVPPGANGVHAVFSDIMDAKRWRHAPPALVGFNVVQPENSGKKECIRAIEEQAAYNTRGHMDILTEITKQSLVELTFAGGSSKGFLWPQIVADVLGVPVKIPKVHEATSLGAAMCALKGIDEFKSWEEAVKRVVRFDRVVQPDMDAHQKYDELYPLWRTVYGYLRNCGDDGVLACLWRGAGV